MIDFAIFYSYFIPLFETCIPRLGEITKLESTENVARHFDTDTKAKWEDTKQALISDPCLDRFDYKKQLYLRIEFSAKGFGYAACQPGNNPDSLAVMHREMRGGPCKFTTKESKLTLRCVAFGSRRTRGNETLLHSHLGEGFSYNWAVNKCRHMTRGSWFTWTTNCYGI